MDPETNANSGENNNEGNSGQEQEKPLDWYKKELEKTRTEAANWRTKLRDAETKLAGAKTAEDIEAAKAELSGTIKKLERDLLVAKVAKGDPEKNVPALPDELAALLQGDTEAELTAHAEKLRKFIPASNAGAGAGKTPPPNLGGGLNGGGKPDTFDVKETARKARLGLL